jgi:hypothetical protein
MNAPKVTIEAELTRDGLLRLRDAIDLLLGNLGDDDNANPVFADLRLKQADRKVGEVWGRVGGNTKRFLATAAVNWPDGGEFTMEDVAKALDVSPKTVRSWHRNLGRTLRQVDEQYPSPRLLQNRTDGARNLYHFPPEIRRAILAREQPASPPAAEWE